MDNKSFSMWLFINICLPKCYISFVDVGTIFEYMAKSKNMTTPHPQPLSRYGCIDYLPKMVIIEPDGVLWPFEVGTGLAKPFLIIEYRELSDSNGTLLKMHKLSAGVIVYLIKKGIRVAVAETTKEIIVMRHLLHLFDIDHLFHFMELDNDSAVNHVKIIKEESGFDYEDLIYFGTNKTVLNEVKEVLNVTTININPQSGISMKHIYKAVYIYYIKLQMQTINGKFELQGRTVLEECVEKGTSSVSDEESKRRVSLKQEQTFLPELTFSFEPTKRTTKKVNIKKEKSRKQKRKSEKSRTRTTKNTTLTLEKTATKGYESVVTRVSGSKKRRVNATLSKLKMKTKRKTVKRTKINKTTLSKLGISSKNETYKSRKRKRNYKT